MSITQNRFKRSNWTSIYVCVITSKALVDLCVWFNMFLEYSVQFSYSVVSNYLQPHGLSTSGFPSPTPGACSNSSPSSRWCNPTISSSVVPFSSCLQSFPALGSFLMSQFFHHEAKVIGVSATASVLTMNIQDWFPLGLTGLMSLQSKGLSQESSPTP